MTNEVLDRAGVLAKFGVPPERIVDYLALIGDTVDNVPGVEKCGAEDGLEMAGAIRNPRWHRRTCRRDQRCGGRQSPPCSLDFLPMAKKLVTVQTDCDLAAQIVSIDESLHSRPEARDELRDLFTRHGFKTWLREVEIAEAVEGPTETPPAPATEMDRHYDTVQTWEQFDEWLARIDQAELTALDTETTSLDPMVAQLVGLSVSVEPGRAAYIPVAHRGPDVPLQLRRDEVLQKLKAWLEDPSKKKVGQHLKYDEQVLANYGIELKGVEHDTLLQSYVLESHRPHDMDNLALRHLGAKTIKYEEVAGKGASQIGFDEVALEQASPYAAEDADITLRLHHALYPQLADEHDLLKVYRDIEMPTSRVLRKMERNGVLIDGEKLRVQSGEIAGRLIELEAEAYLLAGGEFNLGSPKQIGQIFFEKLQLPVVKKTPSGAPSTDEEVLQKLAEDYPLPKILLEHRGLSKLKSTYTDKLPRMVNAKTGRVHTNYAQAVAVTGRLASNDPNLQNIPVRTGEGRRIREAFIAPPGSKIVSADYSQIELRIMAHISGDPSLMRSFAEGEDVHRATALRDLRRHADRGIERPAAHCQGDQLRPDLRHERVRAGVEYRHHARRREALYRPVFPALSGCRELHGRDPLESETRRVRRDGVRAPALAAGNQRRQRAAPARRRARRHQRADARHGRRPDQAFHDRGAGLAGGIEDRDQDDHAGPRRTGARSA